MILLISLKIDIYTTIIFFVIHNRTFVICDVMSQHTVKK